MQGLGRSGGSKYRNIDGSFDLAPPIMLADPSRGVKPDTASLSYNSMIMRNDGGVMSHEHIKEIRERQGYCLTCPNEPIQLFDIKKSKINPLFRAKEAIDSIHESYNGICLKCNPQMDPHHLMRRRSLRRGTSRRMSMGSKSASIESMDSTTTRSRSRSNSPIAPMTPGTAGEGKAIPKPLKMKKNDSLTKRERTKLQTRHNKDDLFVTDIETPISTRSSERSLGAFGTPVNGVSELPHDWTPGSQLSGNSGNALGSLLRNSKPPINKGNVEEFSMPDFSQESTSFKSHRKSKHKETVPFAPPPLAVSTKTKSKTSLTMVKEEKRHPADLFANFNEASFAAQNMDLPVGVIRKAKKSNPKIPYPTDSRHDDSFFEVTDVNSFGKADSRLGSFPGRVSRMDSGLFSSSEDEDDEEFNEEQGDSWDAFDTNEVTDDQWPAPPSIATDVDSRRTGRESGSQVSSDDHSFVRRIAENSRSFSRGSSEQSLTIHDAILHISRSDIHTDSMTPSQLIQADEQLMLGISGIKIDTHVERIDENTMEIEDLKSLLRDVAAAGSSDVLIDMLVATIREHTNSAAIQEICLKQIWDHSKFNEVHKAEIMQAGLKVDIIRAMKSHRRSKKVQENACGCIWSLSVSEQNRSALARAGAVKHLFRALEDFIEDEDVLEVIFGALRTLSPDKEVRDAIVPLLGARRVSRAMAKHRASTSIQRDGCAFLSNVSVDMENQMVSTVHNDELAAVVRALGDHLRNESVVSSACFALKNYTYEEKNLRNLRKFDDVIALLEDASKYSTKAEIRLDANEIRERIQLSGEEDDSLEEIAYSSLRDAMQSPRMTVDEAVETIRDVMKQYEWSEKLLVFGLGSLLSLSRQSEEYMTRITQFDVLKTIVHAMFKQQANANIQHRGCETIKFLAEQGNRPRTMICDVDGSSVLISALRLHRNNETVKAVAVAALEELSKDPRCANMINKELLDQDFEQSGELGSSLASMGESFRTTT